MKGHINENGILFLKRGNQLKEMHCPNNTEEACGDWCPLFEEPSPTHEPTGLPPWILTICQDKNIYFDDFEDLRIKDENQKSK